MRADLFARLILPPPGARDATSAIVPIPVEEGLTLNVAVVWRKDDYLTREAKTFINFCRRTFEAKHDN